MKKQKAKIAVKDLKARKDVKGGSSHISGSHTSGSHITGTKPSGSNLSSSPASSISSVNY